MTYPPSTLPVNAIDGPSATDVSDPAWVLTAAEVNATNVAINDIVTELGTDPSGAEATVTARLSALDSTVAAKADASATAAALAAKAALAGATYTGAHDFTGATVTGISGGGGATVTLDADGTLVVDGTAVELATDGQLASGLAAKSDTGHAHSAADVTTGTLPLARGGTGGTDAATARTALGLGSAAVVNAGTASGEVPVLGAGGVLPVARLATGTPDGNKFIRDDGALAVPAGGSVATGRGKYGGTTLLSNIGGRATAYRIDGIANNRAQYVPFVVPSTIVIDQMVIEVTTAVASGLGRLAIYQADNNWQPGTRLVDSGDIDCSTTGVKAVTISDLTLTPGVYLWWHNASVGGMNWRSCALVHGAFGFTSSLGGSGVAQIYASQAYGVPPSTGLAWDSIASSSSPPISWGFVRVKTA